MVATLRLGLGSPFPSGSAVPGLQLPPQQLRNVCRASWRPQSLAQEAAARLAGRSRLGRRAEAEGRVEGWWSWRKLGRRFGGGGRPRPLPGCESPGCRRMDGASPGGGGSSGGGGSGGGCKCSLHKPSYPSFDREPGPQKRSQSPFPTSPPPRQSAARKTLNFRGGAARVSGEGWRLGGAAIWRARAAFAPPLLGLSAFAVAAAARVFAASAARRDYAAE